MHRLIMLACLAMPIAAPASAQHHGGAHPAASPAPQPYAGFEQREVKALSEQHLADLLAGRGMALALPAELNRYPGPMHVLEHATALALNDHQAASLRGLMDTMRRDAVAAGARVITAEKALDQLFAGASATPDMVAAAAGEAGAAWSALRAVHLVTHIATREVLSPDQLARYGALRGYANR